MNARPRATGAGAGTAARPATVNGRTPDGSAHPDARPYADTADAYRAAGWAGVIPTGLPGQSEAKSPVPGDKEKGEHWTGYKGEYPDDQQVECWKRTYAVNNIAIRLPADVVGIDVDDYDGKGGGATLDELEATYGELPPTIRTTARGRRDRSGIRWYAIKPGTKFPTALGPGIEVIQWFHRYAVVWPSWNPKSESMYRTYDDRVPGRRGDLSARGEVFAPQSVTDLPDEWYEVVGLRREPAGLDKQAPELTNEATLAWLNAHAGRQCRATRNVLNARLAKLEATGKGGRYDAMRDGVMALVRLGAEGHRGTKSAVAALKKAYHDAIAGELGRDPTEWNRSVRGAVSAVATLEETPMHAAGECPERSRQDDRGDDFADLLGDDAQAYAAKAAVGETAAGSGSAPDEFTEAALTDHLAEVLGKGRWCYVENIGWLEWDGRRWRLCAETVVIEGVRRYVRSWLAQEVRAHGRTDRSDKIGKLESRAKLTNLTALLRGRLARRVDELDRHPDLLNVGNGVVDLRTGKIRPHDADLLLTKITDVDYVPDATHRDWRKALDALPADSREYLLARFGQAVTGHPTDDDVLVVMEGAGANGKTTVTAAVKNALGEYAQLVPRSLLLADPRSHPADLMTLRGARFAYIEELPEGNRINVTRLKEIVGPPEITAHAMHKDFVTFTSTHALFVNTNYLLAVAETDHGTWRRLVRVRFPFTYRRDDSPLREGDRTADPRLRDRMKGRRQLEAVLATLIESAMAWYERGQALPEPPPRVQRDTDEWRSNADQVLAFVRECLHFDPAAHVSSAELLKVFCDWQAVRGVVLWSDRMFTDRFGGHDKIRPRGVVKKKTRRSEAASRPPGPLPVGELPETYQAWVGIRFRDDDEGHGT